MSVCMYVCTVCAVGYYTLQRGAPLVIAPLEHVSEGAVPADDAAGAIAREEPQQGGQAARTAARDCVVQRAGPGPRGWGVLEAYAPAAREQGVGAGRVAGT